LTRAEAIDLIRAGVKAERGAIWADFGAGSGTFTEALAEMLGGEANVIAIDRDPAALRDLRHLAQHSPGAHITVASGDVLNLSAIPELHSHPLDGAVFANVLHFVSNPERVLREVRARLKPNAAVIVVEYDRRKASRWVPHPMSLEQLSRAANEAGLSSPGEIGRRESRFQGELYAAVMRSS
jgi:ubiquinone/menaquinone biosynthesis C-methylase UbiE